MRSKPPWEKASPVIKNTWEKSAAGKMVIKRAVVPPGGNSAGVDITGVEWSDSELKWLLVARIGEFSDGGSQCESSNCWPLRENNATKGGSVSMLDCDMALKAAGCQSEFSGSGQLIVGMPALTKVMIDLKANQDVLLDGYEPVPDATEGGSESATSAEEFDNMSDTDLRELILASN